VLKKIYGPVKNESGEDYERRNHTNLNFPYINQILNVFFEIRTSRMVGWEVYVWRAEEVIIWRELINKTTG